MAKVITFGEIMLRLATPGYLRFSQTKQFEATFGESKKYVVFYPRTATIVKIPQGVELDFANCLAGRKSVKTNLW